MGIHYEAWVAGLGSDLGKRCGLARHAIDDRSDVLFLRALAGGAKTVRVLRGRAAGRVFNSWASCTVDSAEGACDPPARWRWQLEDDLGPRNSKRSARP